MFNADSTAVTGVPSPPSGQDGQRQSVGANPLVLQTHQALQGCLAQWHAPHQAPELGVLLGLIDLVQLDDMSESLGWGQAEQLVSVWAQRMVEQLTQAQIFEMRQGRYALLVPMHRVTQAEQIDALATHVLAVANQPLMCQGLQVCVSVSIGWSWSPAPVSSERLLNAALQALRQAMMVGPGVWRFVVMGGPKNRGQHAMDLAHSLRQAIAHQATGGVLSLVYQPQVDLTHGGVVGVEALLRWDHPTLGAVPPDVLIALAERTGLIVPLGAWVLRSACLQAVEWTQRGLPPIRVAVNLSAHQLHRTDIVGDIQSALMDSHLDPERLSIEVTESMLMHDVEAVSRVLKQIRAMGVEIALDDFGTGYSSLSYLRQLPIDVIKVDRSFVHDVTAATQDVSITRAIITMAHSLQMRVLAEGVESGGQLALLVANRCDLMQGYLFSPPCTVEQMTEMLRIGKHLSADQVQRAKRVRTLLLVDDEDNIVAALKRLVRRDGYTVLTANSGHQALQRLAENEVDVIVSDQRMPGMTGVEFLRRAKELYPDTVRMVLSGYTELTSITDAINEGAIYKFLTKPWDDEHLRTHIAQAFVHKEMVDENRRLGLEVQSANGELAQVNDRLNHLLIHQSERLEREELSLGAARELLDSIPTPVIGFDAEGLITFLNHDAARVLDAVASWLGQAASVVLPWPLQWVWRQASSRLEQVHWHGQCFHAVCREVISAGGDVRGKLMVLTPCAYQSIPNGERESIKMPDMLPHIPDVEVS